MVTMSPITQFTHYLCLEFLPLYVPEFCPRHRFVHKMCFFLCIKVCEPQIATVIIKSK